MSRTIKIAHAGGPEVLQFVESNVRVPGAAEIRIRVKAIGINRAESMWRNDAYIEPVKFPAGMGYEAAGVVDAVGRTHMLGARVFPYLPGMPPSLQSLFQMPNTGLAYAPVERDKHVCCECRPPGARHRVPWLAGSSGKYCR